MADKPRVQLEFVYRGPAIGTDGKVYSKWSVVLPQGLLKEPSLFSGKLNSGHVAGQVFMMDATDNEGSAIYSSTASYRRLWPDLEARVKWQAEAVSTNAAIAARKKQKAEGVDPLVTTLAPITRAYSGAVGVNRHQLLARVVEIIVSGRSS